MRIAQTLYEGGFITYMRTDSKTYSEDFVKTVKEHVVDKWGGEYIFEDIDSLTLRQNDGKGVKDEEESAESPKKGKGSKKSAKKTTKKKDAKKKDAKKKDNNAQG